MRTSVSLGAMQRLLEGREEDPRRLLGPHAVCAHGREAVAVRAFLPYADQAWVVDQAHGGLRRPMRKLHASGFFEGLAPVELANAPGRYQILTANERGQQHVMHDPYAFDPLLTDFDLYLLGEGRHWQSYERLGAQLRTVDGVSGVNFAVWAPNATGVSVVGDFNGWDNRQHALRKHLPSGVWELFVPGLGHGTLYKFHVRQGDQCLEKADPYGFWAEVPPRTASRVADLSRYQWHDQEWMANRPDRQGLNRPMSFYEVHLGSWRQDPARPNRWLSYRELAHQLVDYVREQGFTHIELLPVGEHPFSGSWGYQQVGYYAATSRFGDPEDFQYFVDHCHQHGIGVVLDWVPAHFPRDAHGLRMFDGTHLYEHADPRQGEHRDWGTLIFNYGRNEVRNYLISNALFWLDKYHLDGLRVDAVASMLYLDYSRQPDDWVPNQYGGRENLQAIDFVQEFNRQVHAQHPGALTIAEESTAWPGVSRPTDYGGLGFTLKWNMGWMNDTISYMRQNPIHRKFHHNKLTFSLIYAFHENFVLPLSHDEVVHCKGSLLDQMPGDLWQKFANLRLLYGYMWTHPGKKLLFMGGEWGQWNEWNYDGSLQWDLLQWDSHRGLQRMMGDLNRLYQQQPALHQVDFDSRGFEWIDCHNADDSVLSYVRRADDPRDYLVVACNFTPVPRVNYRLGVPELRPYREVFNTDSQFYGGSNVGNGAGLVAAPRTAQGREFSVPINLPPLGLCVLQPTD